jgi:hypothetical protein
MIDPQDYQGLVRQVAKRYAGRGMEFDDVVGWANLGLATAIDQYRDVDMSDHDRRERIFFAVVESVREGFICNQYIRVPRKVSKIASKIRRGAETVDGFTHKRHSRHSLILALCVPDRCPGTEEIFRWVVDRPDFDEPGVQEMLSLLSDLEAVVVQGVLGLDGVDCRTPMEVARMLGLKYTKVKYAFKTAMVKLKKYFGVDP